MIDVTIGEKTFQMKDWNLRIAQKVYPFVMELANPNANRIQLLTDIISAALIQDNPEVTSDYILDNAYPSDLDGFNEAINTQFVKKKPIAQETQTQSTGENSTQA